MKLTFNALLLAIVVSPVLGANFDITVGANNDFIFLPNQIAGALAGDTITFTFVSRNHSATTTTFTNPCPPPPGGFGSGAFDTGFNPTTATDHPVKVITLQDSGTHFVACMQAAGAHCHMGMTLAINPMADQTYDEFLQNALNDPIHT